MKKSGYPKKILSILAAQSEPIILIGGCFDLLHDGHISFINAAKKLGGVLVVLLESDQSIKQTKGEHRPIQKQSERSEALLQTTVDFVILLPYPFLDKDYDDLVSNIKPAIIATTKGDPNLSHKKRQADVNNAKLIEVIDRLDQFSTSKKINNE